MKKVFNYYAIIWAMLLVVFNVIAIVAPGWPSLEKCTPSFWIGYAFVNAAMIGHLLCAWLALKKQNIKKTFYRMSLFSVSFSGLITTVVVGIICMIVTPLPYWISAIVCPVILLYNIIAVLKATVAVEMITNVDEKVENGTAFIYAMRAESDTLLVKAKTEEEKAYCKKVRDAFKFSDPMSGSAAVAVEAEIKNHFYLLQTALANKEMEVVASETDELLGLIAERNNVCKVMK